MEINFKKATPKSLFNVLRLFENLWKNKLRGGVLIMSCIVNRRELESIILQRRKAGYNCNILESILIKYRLLNKYKIIIEDELLDF